MSDLQQDYHALEKVTLNRLLFINSVIRDKRKSATKEQMAEYKAKRKETDILLSNIRSAAKSSNPNIAILKQRYMTASLLF